MHERGRRRDSCIATGGGREGGGGGSGNEKAGLSIPFGRLVCHCHTSGKNDFNKVIFFLCVRSVISLSSSPVCYVEEEQAALADCGHRSTLSLIHSPGLPLASRYAFFP